jgi:hypothetical protein
MQHEFAFQEVLIILADFAGETVQELRLNLAQGLGRFATIPRQAWIGRLPLPQFLVPLALVGTDLPDQFLKQLILTVLTGQKLP